MSSPSIIRDKLLKMGQLSMLHKRTRNECINQMKSLNAPIVLGSGTFYMLVISTFMFVFWSLLTRVQNIKVNTEEQDQSTDFGVNEVQKGHIGAKMVLFTVLAVCLIMNKRPVSATNVFSRLHPVPLFFGFFGMICGTVMLGVIFMNSFSKTYQMKLENPDQNIQLNNMDVLYENANREDVQDAFIYFAMCIGGVFIGVNNQK